MHRVKAIENCMGEDFRLANAKCGISVRTPLDSAAALAISGDSQDFLNRPSLHEARAVLQLP